MSEETRSFEYCKFCEYLKKDKEHLSCALSGLSIGWMEPIGWLKSEEECKYKYKSTLNDKIKIINVIIWFIGVIAISIFIGSIFKISKQSEVVMIILFSTVIIGIIMFFKGMNKSDEREKLVKIIDGERTKRRELQEKNKYLTLHKHGLCNVILLLLNFIPDKENLYGDEGYKKIKKEIKDLMNSILADDGTDEQIKNKLYTMCDRVKNLEDDDTYTLL